MTRRDHGSSFTAQWSKLDPGSATTIPAIKYPATELYIQLGTIAVTSCMKCAVHKQINPFTRHSIAVCKGHHRSSSISGRSALAAVDSGPHLELVGFCRGTFLAEPAIDRSSIVIRAPMGTGSLWIPLGLAGSLASQPPVAVVSSPGVGCCSPAVPHQFDNGFCSVHQVRSSMQPRPLGRTRRRSKQQGNSLCRRGTGL
jgi:hypothetical protein